MHLVGAVVDRLERAAAALRLPRAAVLDDVLLRGRAAQPVVEVRRVGQGLLSSHCAGQRQRVHGA